ncbi:MAG: hypothetical protein WA903_13745 [Ornithinimicrobium sp.]
MTTSQWLLIILLVVLIAVGIWMLMRKPSAGQDRSPENEHDASHVAASEEGVSSYDAGGEHVAAGDAGVAPGPALYDQEADARTDDGPPTAAYGDVTDDQVSQDEMWDETDASDSEGARQDTATGTDVPIVEEEPIVPADQHAESDEIPFDQHDLDTPTDHGEQAEPVSQVHNGDRDQMSYGEPATEDFASETTYADAPPEETLKPVGEDSAESRDLGAASPGTGVHDEMLDLEHEQALEADTYSPVGEETSYDLPADAAEHEHEGDDVPADAASAGFTADLHGSVDEHPAAQDSEPNAVTADEHETAERHDDQNDHGFTDSDRNAGDVNDEDRQHDDRQHDEPGSDQPEVVMVDAGDFPATTSDDHESAPADQHDEVESGEHHQDETVIADEHETAERHDDQNDQNDQNEHGFTDSDRNAGDVNDEDRQHDDRQHDEPDGDQPEVAMVDAGDFPATTSDDHETAPTDRQETQEEAATGEDQIVEERVDSNLADPADTEHDVAVERDHHDGDQGSADMDADSSETSEPQVVESPYGPGSVFADDDGSVPSGYDIKGNAGSMLFHTPESPSYESSVPEVYFNSEEAARAAGFAHWDRKRR